MRCSPYAVYVAVVHGYASRGGSCSEHHASKARTVDSRLTMVFSARSGSEVGDVLGGQPEVRVGPGRPLVGERRQFTGPEHGVLAFSTWCAPVGLDRGMTVATLRRGRRIR